jgi:hypothetical protein
MTATERAAEGGTGGHREGYLVTGRTLMDTGPGHAEGRRSLERDLHPCRLHGRAGVVRDSSSKRVSAAVWEGAMAVGLVHRFRADLMGS